MSVSLAQGLFLRELGLMNNSLKYSIEKKRLEQLQLSKKLSFESHFSGPITWLDIDTADGNFLLSSGADGRILIYDLDNRNFGLKKTIFKPILSIARGGENHESLISCLQWYPNDSGMFFTGGFDEYVKIWDTNLQKVVLEFNLKDPIHNLHVSSFSSNPLIIVGASNQTSRIIDIRKKNAAQTLSGHKDSILGVKWIPNEEYLAATCSFDKSIKIWDIRKPGCLITLDQENEPIFHTYNGKENKIPTSAHHGAITSITFTSDGRYLLSSGKDNRVRSWSTINDFQNTHINFPNIKNQFNQPHLMAISHNNQFFFHPNGKQIGVYEINSGKLVKSLIGHLDRINAIVSHPFKEEVYSAGNDREIFVYVPMKDESDFEKEFTIDNEDDWDN